MSKHKVLIERAFSHIQSLDDYFKDPLTQTKNELSNNNDGEAAQCEICYTNNKNVILPCKHELCSACLRSIENSKCPYCKHTFELKDIVPIKKN